MANEVAVLDKIKSCIEHQQNFLLQGGAGSGKTETLKGILEYIVKEHPEKKVVCITHTNLAVDEIKARVGDYCTVSTIHSFLNSLIKDYKKNIQHVISALFTIPTMKREELEYYNGDKKRQQLEEYDKYKKLYKKYSSLLFMVTNQFLEKIEGKKQYDEDPVYFNEILNDGINRLNQQIIEEIASKDYNAIAYNEATFDESKPLSSGHDGLLTIRG